ncbi:hypothetical protein DSECCO2_538760 [anaerobic digester metagenome]
MASHKVFLGNQILAVDGLFAKAQVATSDTAALLAVVLEITLHVEVSVVADNLDAVLVCANGTV